MNTEQRDTELRINGQRFRFAGALTTTDRPDAYVVLTARCCECGAAFMQIVTQSQIGAAALVRRCEAHRQPRSLRIPPFVHPSAFERPPAIGDLRYAPPVRGDTPTKLSLRKADLSQVVLQRPKKPAITVRDFLAAMLDGWPGRNALRVRLDASADGAASAANRVIAAGLLSRVGKGNTTKFVLTAAGRAAVAGIKEAKHGV